MNAFNIHGVAFATKTAAAAIAAILLALWFHLPNPGWAGLTVFLTSQQLGAASGAVIGRSVYRVWGTLLAVAGILFFIPVLNAAPELLVLGIAAWVGLCLYLSLLDRSPRSYVFLLAAYTLPLIGMPLANTPSSVFDVTMWRVEEIGLGAAMSVVVHTVFAPGSVKPLLLARVRSTIGDARSWILAGLSPQPAGSEETSARKRLGADLTELRNLAALLRFEPGIAPQDIATVSWLEERLLALLPLLAGVEDRLAALRASDPGLAARVDTHLEAVRLHVTRPLEPADAARLRASGGALVDPERRDLAHGELLAIAAIERLAELLDGWDQCLALLHRLEHPDAPERVPFDTTRKLAAEASPRTLHVDHGLAALSGLAAALAVVIAGALCWTLGWDQGGATMGIAAVGSSLFAFLDDPRPFLKLMLSATALAVPVAAVYAFAILPAADGYVALALALAPLFFIDALLLSTPKWSVHALGFILIAVTLISVQPVQAGDFWSFVATAVGALLGTSIALVVVSVVRVIGVEASARRLVRAAWRDLAAMADGTRRLSRAAWGGRMMDRVGLLQARMPGTSGALRARAVRVLDDLRLGVNMLDLRDAGLASRPEVRTPVERALAQIAAHFRQRLAHPDIAPAPAILLSIDRAIAGLIESGAGSHRVHGLTAATGLRLSLFPQAPAAATPNGDAQ